MNPIAQLRTVTDGDHEYQVLMFWCPGCEIPDEDGVMQGGTHMLVVSGDSHGRPVWTFDGNLDAPTLSPSILTRTEHTRRRIDGESRDVGLFVCHSFMRAGQMEFLGDCTHALAGKTVPLPPLPDWLVKE